MKTSILRTLIGLCLFAAALPLSAQVSYIPNRPSIDTSNTNSLGGTVTIRYDLQGSPAESPLGASFYLTLTYSPISNVAGTNPMGFISIDHATPTSFPVRATPDGSILRVSDVLALTPEQIALGDVRDSARNGLISPNYTFTVDSSIPSAAGWEVTSGDLQLTGSQSGGGSADDWGGSSFSMLLTGASNFLLPIGDTGTVGLFYYSRGNVPPSLTAPGDPTRNSMTDLFNVNPLDFDVRFPNIVFNQVPEAGSAMLALAGGAILLLRRPSRRKGETVSGQPCSL
ncbi:hypothetical protein FEM03_00070 [Phragmitibacter flavus]|uniref:PEP-CTERM sorting domain-containing protein n=1 Tax=Phragmitibacter flavus TaxID=2576071 RepID=A0A5R8KJS7_9BACT|nr:hypothetical protein [Phragmitibacter flavus]TLD72510.1 hypothetical protein FEM03_00070 [Phragmitibacter flavus]